MTGRAPGLVEDEPERQMANQHFCHNCGNPTSEDASFCLQCGASLQPASEGKCPQCGQENDLNDQFCGECGTSLFATPAGYQHTPNDSQQLPMVGFGEAITLALKKTFTYSGRARRSEFWWWVLLTVLISFVPILGAILALFMWIPTVSLTARRLHDVGRSGWWQLLPWAFGIGGFIIVFSTELLGVILVISAFISSIALFVLYILKGNLGPNQYGPDPRQFGSN